MSIQKKQLEQLPSKRVLNEDEKFEHDQIDFRSE